RMSLLYDKYNNTILMLDYLYFKYISIPTYALQRTLLSFPTRRSSDLSGCLVSETPLLDASNATATPLAEGVYEACADPKEGEERSEEHTSELQSRENLVCRLLLEKKKKIQTKTCHNEHNKYIRV